MLPLYLIENKEFIYRFLRILFFAESIQNGTADRTESRQIQAPSETFPERELVAL